MIYNKEELDIKDVELLKIGRHFRLSENAKLVIGRNYEENKKLVSFADSSNIVLNPVDIPGPTGVLDVGVMSAGLLELSAMIVAHYCDKKEEGVYVSVESGVGHQTISCPSIKPTHLDQLRI